MFGKIEFSEYVKSDKGNEVSITSQENSRNKPVNKTHLLHRQNTNMRQSIWRKNKNSRQTAGLWDQSRPLL